MKPFILLISLFILCQVTYAQCDQSITFKCTKARGLKNGAIEKEMPMEATISLDSGRITLTASMNGETQTINGEIREITICEWKDFLKDGKTKYKAFMKKGDSDSENSFITIESENGYTKITFSSDPDTGSALQFDVAEYAVAGGSKHN